MKRKVLKRTLTAVLMILCVSTAVMIYLSNIESTAFDQGLYEDRYEELDVYSNFPEGTDLVTPTRELIGYMESGTGTLRSDFFNEREKEHMVEVRHLFGIVDTLLDTAVIISVISLFTIFCMIRQLHLKMSLEGMDKLLKGVITRFLIWTGWLVDGIAVFLGVVAMTFSTSFIRFHEIFFVTDTWMLDPATDNMINMFPQQFFFDMFIRIILMSIIAATVMLVAGYLIRLGVPDRLKCMPRRLFRP